ncbi:MAG: hypothetical protein NUV84_03970 [Candidatus Uhrbacteria bacterium]|nr:hypothetical protein [Candidatus Uhrbacteria bacterium]
MGLFKSLGFGKKEGESTEMSPEAPKQELKENGAAQTGRERVNAIKEGGTNLWNRFKENARSAGNYLGRKAMEAFDMAVGTVRKGGKMAKKGGSMAIEGAFSVVGGIEKGAKATVEGGKAALEYAKETGREGMEIKDLAVMAVKDTATRTKEAAIDAGYTGVLLAMLSGEKGVALAKALKDKGVELKSAVGRKTIENAAALAALGIAAVAAVEMFGSDKIEQAVATASQAKDAGIDLAKQGGEMILLQLVAAASAGIVVAVAIEERVGKVGKAVLEKGAEFYGAAKEKMDALRGRAREAKDGFFARISAARDRFSSRLKDMVLEAFRPEIDQMIQKKAKELLADRERLSVAENLELEEGLDEVENFNRVGGWDVEEVA